MKVTILDTGAGNLHSLEKAFAIAAPGARMHVEADAGRALSTDVLVLPGVGAWGPAAARLAPVRERVRDALVGGLPAIGICLGMQLLFDTSEEGTGAGLGVIPGAVTRLTTERTPHMGWTPVSSDEAWLRSSLPDALYFAHSFACRPAQSGDAIAFGEVPGDRFAAIVKRARTIGCQFHPEKSSARGVAFIGKMLEMVTQ
jgi:glutamine amidotransferase